MVVTSEAQIDRNPRC